MTTQRLTFYRMRRRIGLERLAEMRMHNAPEHMIRAQRLAFVSLRMNYYRATHQVPRVVN